MQRGFDILLLIQIQILQCGSRTNPSRTSGFSRNGGDRALRRG